MNLYTGEGDDRQVTHRSIIDKSKFLPSGWEVADTNRLIKEIAATVVADVAITAGARYAAGLAVGSGAPGLGHVAAIGALATYDLAKVGVIIHRAFRPIKNYNRLKRLGRTKEAWATLGVGAFGFGIIGAASEAAGVGHVFSQEQKEYQRLTGRTDEEIERETLSVKGHSAITGGTISAALPFLTIGVMRGFRPISSSSSRADKSVFAKNIMKSRKRFGEPQVTQDQHGNVVDVNLDDVTKEGFQVLEGMGMIVYQGGKGVPELGRLGRTLNPWKDSFRNHYTVDLDLWNEYARVQKEFAEKGVDYFDLKDSPTFDVGRMLYDQWAHNMEGFTSVVNVLPEGITGRIAGKIAGEGVSLRGVDSLKGTSNYDLFKGVNRILRDSNRLSRTRRLAMQEIESRLPQETIDRAFTPRIFTKDEITGNELVDYPVGQYMADVLGVSPENLLRLRKADKENEVAALFSPLISRFISTSNTDMAGLAAMRRYKQMDFVRSIQNMAYRPSLANMDNLLTTLNRMRRHRPEDYGYEDLSEEAWLSLVDNQIKRIEEYNDSLDLGDYYRYAHSHRKDVQLEHRLQGLIDELDRTIKKGSTPKLDEALLEKALIGRGEFEYPDIIEVLDSIHNRVDASPELTEVLENFLLYRLVQLYKVNKTSQVRAGIQDFSFYNFPDRIFEIKFKSQTAKDALHYLQYLSSVGTTGKIDPSQHVARKYLVATFRNLIRAPIDNPKSGKEAVDKGIIRTMMNIVAQALRRAFDRNYVAYSKVTQGAWHNLFLGGNLRYIERNIINGQAIDTYLKKVSLNLKKLGATSEDIKRFNTWGRVYRTYLETMSKNPNTNSESAFLKAMRLHKASDKEYVANMVAPHSLPNLRFFGVDGLPSSNVNPIKLTSEDVIDLDMLPSKVDVSALKAAKSNGHLAVVGSDDIMRAIDDSTKKKLLASLHPDHRKVAEEQLQVWHKGDLKPTKPKASRIIDEDQQRQYLLDAHTQDIQPKVGDDTHVEEIDRETSSSLSDTVARNKVLARKKAEKDAEQKAKEIGAIGLQRIATRHHIDNTTSGLLRKNWDFIKKIFPNQGDRDRLEVLARNNQLSEENLRILLSQNPNTTARLKDIIKDIPSKERFVDDFIHELRTRTFVLSSKHNPVSFQAVMRAFIIQGERDHMDIFRSMVEQDYTANELVSMYNRLKDELQGFYAPQRNPGVHGRSERLIQKLISRARRLGHLEKSTVNLRDIPTDKYIRENIRLKEGETHEDYVDRMYSQLLSGDKFDFLIRSILLRGARDSSFRNSPFYDMALVMFETSLMRSKTKPHLTPKGETIRNAYKRMFIYSLRQTKAGKKYKNWRRIVRWANNFARKEMARELVGEVVSHDIRATVQREMQETMDYLAAHAGKKDFSNAEEINLRESITTVFDYFKMRSHVEVNPYVHSLDGIVLRETGRRGYFKFDHTGHRTPEEMDRDYEPKVTLSLNYTPEDVDKADSVLQKRHEDEMYDINSARQRAGKPLLPVRDQTRNEEGIVTPRRLVRQDYPYSRDMLTHLNMTIEMSDLLNNIPNPIVREIVSTFIKVDSVSFKPLRSLAADKRGVNSLQAQIILANFARRAFNRLTYDELGNLTRSLSMGDGYSEVLHSMGTITNWGSLKSTGALREQVDLMARELTRLNANLDQYLRYLKSQSQGGIAKYISKVEKAISQKRKVIKLRSKEAEETGQSLEETSGQIHGLNWYNDQIEDYVEEIAEERIQAGHDSMFKDKTGKEIREMMIDMLEDPETYKLRKIYSDEIEKRYLEEEMVGVSIPTKEMKSVLAYHNKKAVEYIRTYYSFLRGQAIKTFKEYRNKFGDSIGSEEQLMGQYDDFIKFFNQVSELATKNRMGDVGHQARNLLGLPTELSVPGTNIPLTGEVIMSLIIEQPSMLSRILDDVINKTALSQWIHNLPGVRLKNVDKVDDGRSPGFDTYTDYEIDLDTLSRDYEGTDVSDYGEAQRDLPTESADSNPMLGQFLRYIPELARVIKDGISSKKSFTEDAEKLVSIFGNVITYQRKIELWKAAKSSPSFLPLSARAIIGNSKGHRHGSTPKELNKSLTESLKNNITRSGVFGKLNKNVLNMIDNGTITFLTDPVQSAWVAKDARILIDPSLSDVRALFHPDNGVITMDLTRISGKEFIPVLQHELMRMSIHKMSPGELDNLYNTVVNLLDDGTQTYMNNRFREFMDSIAEGYSDLQRLRETKRAYENEVRINPDNVEAKANLDRVNKEIRYAKKSGDKGDVIVNILSNTINAAVRDIQYNPNITREQVSTLSDKLKLPTGSLTQQDRKEMVTQLLTLRIARVLVNHSGPPSVRIDTGLDVAEKVYKAQTEIGEGSLSKFDPVKGFEDEGGLNVLGNTGIGVPINSDGLNDLVKMKNRVFLRKALRENNPLPHGWSVKHIEVEPEDWDRLDTEFGPVKARKMMENGEYFVKEIAKGEEVHTVVLDDSSIHRLVRLMQGEDPSTGSIIPDEVLPPSLGDLGINVDIGDDL